MSRNGEPMSLYSPAFTTMPFTPIFSRSFSMLANSIFTPMLPVSVPGLATILSAAAAT